MTPPVWMIFATGVVFIAVSIPLILKKVPPNCYYGFRTRKTLADEAIWYKANAFMGWGMVWASVVSMGFAAAVLVFPEAFSRDFLRFYAGPIVVAPVGAALGASILYLRSL